MAEAVLELYPDTSDYWPCYRKWLYYDFHREQPFSTEDLDAIEQRMHEIVDRTSRLYAASGHTVRRSLSIKKERAFQSGVGRGYSGGRDGQLLYTRAIY